MIWKTAEEIFPGVTENQQPADIPYDYSAIAVCAAKQGNKQDALRIWRAATNISPIEMRLLGNLADAGLINELMEYYLEMQKKIPSSEVPANALKLLQAQ